MSHSSRTRRDRLRRSVSGIGENGKRTGAAGPCEDRYPIIRTLMNYKVKSGLGLGLGLGKPAFETSWCNATVRTLMGEPSPRPAFDFRPSFSVAASFVQNVRPCVTQ